VRRFYGSPQVAPNCARTRCRAALTAGGKAVKSNKPRRFRHVSVQKIHQDHAERCATRQNRIEGAQGGCGDLTASRRRSNWSGNLSTSSADCSACCRFGPAPGQSSGCCARSETAALGLPITRGGKCLHRLIPRPASSLRRRSPRPRPHASEIAMHSLDASPTKTLIDVDFGRRSGREMGASGQVSTQHPIMPPMVAHREAAAARCQRSRIPL